ncbi:MAG: malto-oligosyltrehalose synthase, partial [Bacteroidota bacterium]
MAEGTALEQLAERHGVALEYFDIWGNRHRAAPESLAAILNAMGVRTDGGPAAEAALAAEEATRWRRVLPAVMVVRADRLPSRVRLTLPAALDDARLAWRVHEESGAEHGGELVPGALPVLESAAPADGTAHYAARELALPVTPPPGYHRLEILHGGAALAAMPLIVVPPQCYAPPALAGGGRVWGVTAQLYAVRSERNWGIGDFSDLRALVEQWGARGAAMIGVNPLHALFPHNPAHASPYSPSSRLFVNTLYVDVEAVDDYRECEEARVYVRSAAFQARLKALREAELVDYPAVAAAKLDVLERLYGHFRRRHLGEGAQGTRAQAFRAFQAREGERLRRHALFEALQERFYRADPTVWGWPVWPEACRDPAASEVERLAGELAERVEFYAYLQWQADVQLAAVGRRSFELGLAVGLYQDLAVSVDRAGAETWSNQDLYAAGASVGAPPDDFALNGQDWGLPPLVPDRLRETAFEPFVATLRAGMRHAGALRIDHVMGLMRLFWVPPGGAPKDGAYVHYPLDDLLGLVALESQRNRCLVVGEDLGTVPDEVRAALAAAGVLSYRLLYFERGAAGDFRPPGEYPAQAIVAASTHDLPTLAGWWSGADLELRASLGLFPSAAAREEQVVGRAQDRARLLLALERESLLPAGATVDPVSLPGMTPELVRALHLYLARSPAQLLAVQLEDALGVRDQVNLPGTAGEHPNWRRKLPLALERVAEHEPIAELANALTRLRGRPKPAAARRDRSAAATIPRATYRVQLHSDFGFAQATELVPYLARLGVSHVYCSPYLRARAGSRHGYDIIDHGALNPEIGNRDDFERFVGALKAHGMGQLLDMVPNHMGVMGADNAWWMDVLEDGPASAYADHFDIEWQPVDQAFAGKVVLPVLGDHYGEVLERGELKPVYEPGTGGFAIWYFEHRFPVDPREYPRLLERAQRLLAPGALPGEAAAELESLIAALGRLPPRDAATAAAVAERARDKTVLKGRLARLAREHPRAAEAIEHAVRAFAGVAGEAASFEPLHELLEAQAYRLAYWRVAADEINYRRFFDINDLAALRMENEAVFEATHRFALELAAEGAVDGLRIDHPDGPYDPARYFRRLQERYTQLASLDGEAGERPRRLYVVAEKIIAPHEQLPETWPVHGTTGYRFANVVNGLFVDADARSRVDRAWRAFVREEAVEFDEAAYRAKRLIMRNALAGELNVLANRLLRLARASRRTRDYTQNTLRQALTEVVACFPVYRTYITDRPTLQDRRYVDWAVGRAKRRARAADSTVFDFVRGALLARAPAGAPAALAAEYRAFAMRFQQFTAPVTAKGVEDTAFYVFNRLVALNEVG